VGLLALVGALLMLSGSYGQQPEATLEVTFLDVGHGDCIYVQLPHRPDVLYDDLLVDGGNAARGARELKKFLEERGQDKVDLVFLTHAHADHAGGLAAVLEPPPQGEQSSPDGIEFDRLYYSGTDFGTKTFKRLMELAGDRAEVLRRGDKVDLDADEKDDLSLEVLNPPSGPLSTEENDNSLVLLLTYGDEKFLLAGDIEEDSGRQLLEAYKKQLHAQVLKVPHHGSDTSSSPPFVAAVSPQFAVVCTDGKSYGLPNDDVLDRYRQAGAEVLRTDEDGTISFLATEQSLAVTTERPDEPSATQ
jgi:competence protein ComEC